MFFTAEGEGRRRRILIVVAAVTAVVCAVAVTILAQGLPEFLKDDGLTPAVTPPPDDEQSARCSASGMSAVPVDQPALPEAVDAARRALIAAAVACDYERLEELTVPDFALHLVYDASGNLLDLGSPAEYWQALERGVYITGGPAKRYVRRPLAKLVAILNAPYATLDEVLPSYSGKSIFTWPELGPKYRSRGTLGPMRDVYGKQTVREFLIYERRGMAYFGYRTQIDLEGAWLILFSGD